MNSKNKEMSEDDLKALVSTHISNAVGYADDTLTGDRSEAMKRYKGEPYGTEEDGRSSVVSKDIMDTVEWFMPSMMKVFHAGDKVVEFEPESEEDVDAAEQATDYVDFVHMRDNDGFSIDYCWFKDAFINRNGYTKTWWRETEQREEETFEGLTLEDLTMRMEPRSKGETVEIVEQQDTVVVEAEVDEGGYIISPELRLYDVTICRKKTIGRIKEMNVPGEEMLIAPYTRVLSKEDCVFAAHWTTQTRSELLAEGYDKDAVNDLPRADAANLQTDEKQERHKTEGGLQATDTQDSSMDDINLHECYMWVDFDGDGQAEYRKIIVAGNNTDAILVNEVVDDMPFDDLTPIMMPHTHWGMSVVDLVEDLQKIKTAIMRQMLDGLYAANDPSLKVVVDQSGNPMANMDDLLSRKLNRTIRVKSMDAVERLNEPWSSAQAFPMLEYLDSEMKDRTGSNTGGGLDPNALNNQAGSFANSEMVTGAKMRVELIARVFAETGYKRRFRRMLRILAKHQDEERMVRLRGKFVPMDPSSWNKGMDMTVDAALGTVESGKKMQFYNLMLQIYRELLPQGGLGLAGPAQIYNTLESIGHEAGVHSTGKYVTDPSTPDGQANAKDTGGGPSDSEVLMKIETNKAEMENKRKAAELQFKREEMLRQDDRERERNTMNFTAQIARIEADTGVKVDAQNFQRQMAIAKLIQDAEQPLRAAE